MFAKVIQFYTYYTTLWRILALTHPIIMVLEKYAYSFMHYVIANQQKSVRKREFWHYKNTPGYDQLPVEPQTDTHRKGDELILRRSYPDRHWCR